MIKRFYLTHRQGPHRYYHSWQSGHESTGNEGAFTALQTPGQNPHHQMQFSVICGFAATIQVNLYYRSAFNKFPAFLKIQYVIAIHLMRWLTNFYDFTFKWTATTAIGIHPTKDWLPQLVNFKNAIWTRGHFRRTIYNEILFWTRGKCHRNVWDASDCFWSILHELSISAWVA